MKIALTGASGFIGRQIVPSLSAAGVDLLLLGRSRERLCGMYPQLQCASYERLGQVLEGSDMVVHLAVRNNDQPGTRDEFIHDNVDFTLQVLAAARDAKVKNFVAVSSVQTLTGAGTDSYVDSKRRMEAVLKAETGIEISILHLPIVYGTDFAGKLAVLNRLPRPLLNPAFTCLSALKPTLHVDRLSGHILGGAPTAVLTDGQERNPVFKLVKRTADLAFALVVILFFWWLLALVWAAVKLTSRGPGIFSQVRLGQHEQEFVIYKFRTMAKGTRQAGTHEVTSSSVTRIGKRLRASKLDELPQVWNLLLGQISLIGPRPGLPGQDALKIARRRLGVFSVRPGISGLSQIEGIDMSTPERLARRDADYITLQGLAMELRIAAATARGSGAGDRVSTD